MQLMKGTSRGGIQGNDIGLLFCTTVRATAEKYTFWSDGELVAFDVRDDLVIADLNDEKTARRIVNAIVAVSPYEYDADAYVAELIDNDGTDEIAIMDDPEFRQAVADLGYDGATQSGHYALFAACL